MEKLTTRGYSIRFTFKQWKWICDEVERRNHGNYATNRCNRSALIREIIEESRKKDSK